MWKVFFLIFLPTSLNFYKDFTAVPVAIVPKFINPFAENKPHHIPVLSLYFVRLNPLISSFGGPKGEHYLDPCYHAGLGHSGPVPDVNRVNTAFCFDSQLSERTSILEWSWILGYFGSKYLNRTVYSNLLFISLEYYFAELILLCK